jgi:hypothetical protein
LWFGVMRCDWGHALGHLYIFGIPTPNASCDYAA